MEGGFKHGNNYLNVSPLTLNSSTNICKVSLNIGINRDTVTIWVANVEMHSGAIPLTTDGKPTFS